MEKTLVIAGVVTVAFAWVLPAIGPQPYVAALSSEPHNPTVGGDPPWVLHKPQCVDDELSDFVRRVTAGNRKRLGIAQQNAIAGIPSPLYHFYPMAGDLHGDIFNGGFVDLDPSSPGFHDFVCRPFTYDGHAGIDTEVRSFAEQFIGVPVFAARDGIVVFAQDGWDDTNVNGGVQGNIIAIDHSNGIESQYYHLKNGSVAVAIGENVKAGQQIGMVASSGNSFGPHLHFQTMVDGQVYEPFAGACRAGESGWSDQTPLDNEDLYLTDFGTTRTDLATLDPPWWEPWPLPTDAQFALDDPFIVFWWKVYNFPVDCPWRVRFFKPDNSLAWTAEFTWGNTEIYRVQKSWFGFDFQPMGPVIGTWRIVFELNGEVMIDAPFEVVETIDPGFNRPPLQPSGLIFDPPAPTAQDVLFCRLSTELAGEDSDWDVVRYRYVWRVNGNVVRDVVTAAHSDAIAHSRACGGSTVSVTVTPNDGTVNGPPIMASVEVVGPISPDINCDGSVNVDDLLAIINA